MAGPWEQVTPSGTDGVFLNIRTWIRPTVNQQRVTERKVMVRVYHRQNGEETWGWYEGSLDERHLRVADIDVSFHPEDLRWTGTWGQGNGTRQVVLGRPHPSPGQALHSLCGDWELAPASRWGEYQSFHIVESSDGRLTGWMDYSGISVDISQNDGEPYDVMASMLPEFELRHQNGNRFIGTLSTDGTSFSGHWDIHQGLTSGPGVPVPTVTFRRAR